MRRVANRKLSRTTYRRPSQMAIRKKPFSNKLTFLRKVKLRHVIYVLLAIVILQFLYPSDRALPNTKLADVNYGLQSTDKIAQDIQKQFATSAVELKADDSAYTVKIAQLDTSIDANNLAKELAQYNWWQRLIPLSAFFPRSLEPAKLDFNDDNLDQIATDIASKLNSEAKNATIDINKDNQIVVVAAKNKVSVKAESVANALKGASYKIGQLTSVEVKADIGKPEFDNAAVDKIKNQLTTMSQQQINITNNLTKSVSVPSDKDILSWLNISSDNQVTYDEDAIKSYLNKIAGGSIIEAGTTTIVMVDGKESSRTTGKNGRGVDNAPIIASVKKALDGKENVNIAMNFAETAPKIVYDRSYNHSQKALQSYVDQVSKTGTIAISVKQLNGDGWSASSKATNSVVSASTYKLFISLLLFKKINSGEINWTDSIQGTNVKNCLRNTIVISANNCSEQWIKSWGRNNVNSKLYSLGFSTATNFAASDATHTSAADLQKLLIGLYDKTLFTSDDANYLIGLMKQQVYRKGIPAGSEGTVADKVGFLWGYLNDAAIVYHPKGDYVLVIMTNNQSWSKIAEITSKIENIMYGTD